MKQLITATVAFLLFTLAATAQQRKCGNETNNTPRKGKKEFAHKMNLTDAQKEKAKQINTNYKQELKTLNSNDKITLGEYKARKNALQETRKTNTKAILTSDQLKQIETAKATKKANHAAKQEKKMAKLKENLNLTASQIATMKTQKAANTTKIEQIKNDNSLSKEQKKEQLKEMKKANHDKFVNSLTTEQKQKLSELKKNKKVTSK